MRARGPILAGLAIVVVAVGAAVVWPSVAETARRKVADRLREETGQDWRVDGVGLSFSPVPQIVLRNLAFGDDREGSEVAGGRIRELRLNDPVSLLLGSGSSGSAVAEAVSLRAPISGKTASGSAPMRSGGKPAALQITARDADVVLAEAGRAAVVSAHTLDISFDLDPPRKSTELRVSLELPHATAAANLDWPASAQERGDFTLTLNPREAKGIRIAASGKTQIRKAGLSLESLSGTIDNAPFKGAFAVDWDQPKPRITLDAQLDALTLVDSSETSKIGGSSQSGLVIPISPDIVPDVRWFSGFEATGRVGAARVTLGPARFESVAISGNIKNGTLDAALTSAAGYGGNARGRYVLSPETDGAGRHQLALSLGKMQVLPLLSDIAGVRGIDGSGTLRVDLQAKGAEVDSVRRSLLGSADLTITDGRIDGLDLAGTLGLIAPQGSRGSGFATRLERLAGAFTINEGQAVTNDLMMKSSLIEAKGIGSIDLIARTLDIQFKPQVVASGARQQGSRNPLDIPVRISGPWTNPSVSADLAGLAENPAGALQSLQDLGSNIMGEKGGDDIGGAIGGLLDGLFGKSDRGSPLRPRSRSLDPDADSAR